MKTTVGHLGGQYTIQLWDEPNDAKDFVAIARKARVAKKLPKEEEDLLAKLVRRPTRPASRLYVLEDPDGTPVAAQSVTFGPRRKENGEWGKYLTQHVMYTIVPFRWCGLNTRLWNFILNVAVENGYARYTARVGTLDGVITHYRWGSDFWGIVPGGELLVDSPLVLPIGSLANSRIYYELPPRARECWEVDEPRGARRHYFPLTRHQITEALGMEGFGEGARHVWIRHGHRPGSDFKLNPKARHGE